MNYRLKSLFFFSLAFPMMLSAQVRVEQLLEKGWKFTREDQATFSNEQLISTMTSSLRLLLRMGRKKTWNMPAEQEVYLS